MSASAAAISWCCAIGLPIVSRDFAYSSAKSVAPWASPSPCAPIPGLERSRIRIAIRKPSPSSPSRLAAGMRQSSKKISPVAEPLHGQQQPGGRADLGELLDRDEHHQRARGRAAVCLVEREAEELVLAKQLDHVPGELGRFVDLRRPRRDPLARERAHELPDL